METKEEIEIKQVHDNNKFIVKRTITEELNKEELLKVNKEIHDALKQANQNVAELPQQAEKRLQEFKRQQEVLQRRFDSFNAIASKFLPKDNAEEKHPEVQVAQGTQQ